jgi:phenylalanyl-tRNA synthetase alpha chain
MSEAQGGPLLDEGRGVARAALGDIAMAGDLESLAKVRARYVGKQGEIRALLKRISSVPAAERPATGAEINRLAQDVEQALDARRAELEASASDGPPDATFDPTLPGTRRAEGSLHVVTLVLDEIRAIFTRLGFDEVTGPELEDEWHNFDALNIPADHVARSPQDNFQVEGGRLLRSQTSTMQIRAMETKKPPLRVFAPGRVYRPDAVDARHLYAFHQVEGLMVGEDVTFADLKACLVAFAQSMYGDDVVTRFRPSYFPFTEVSAELDLQCPGCGGRAAAARCPVCGGEGWMEILGCGMVHPNVFRHVGYDPERYTGFAFGMGVERVAMRRWKLDDVRLLSENDVRFLEQFR